MSSIIRTDCHVAQQTRRDKLRFDQDQHQPPPMMFGFPSGSGDLHTALYKPDPLTNFQSNLELLPYSSSSQLYQGHELAQMLLPPNQNQLPSLTLASSNSHCAVGSGCGPLGPFTGYAAVLKGSRFLKPAQLLLEELCGAVKGGRAVCDELSECVFGGSKEGNNGEGVSSSSLCSSTEPGCDVGHSEVRMHRPEFQQTKTKLLYMQDEVCRRYKQYHQQIQMVVSSFESVPGLSSATPYTTLALKTISKHFRRLKSVISSQLQQISQILGEESTSSPSSSRGALLGSHTRLPYMEHNHPVWRPQRGLPERAVSVLRAWLFDHFLHPYPTDADKHMLATQTGLSRNQVSNWFINARVRLWKPMVEEIHMLETKGKSRLGLGNSATTSKVDSKPGVADGTRKFSNQTLQECEHVNPSSECSLLDPVWHVDKRSRVQDDAMEGNLISFGGFSGNEMDIGGFGGAVSLTLGLRHDGVQQHQHPQLRQFGGQMFHDFVG